MSGHSTTARCVVYARKSTLKQEESIARQLAWARPACAEKGLAVAAEFVDEGRSGHDTEERPGLMAMLDFCRQEARRGAPVPVVVVWKGNRLSRADTLETGWLLHEMRKAGVAKLLTSERWYDFARREDRLLLGVDQDFASNTYCPNLAGDSTAGKVRNAEAGKWNGGRVPYGYRLLMRANAKGRMVPDRLDVDPETAPVVRRLFEGYASGRHSLRTLAAELNARGEPTPSRRLGAARPAALWSVPCIRNILTSEVYLGAAVWNRTRQGRFVGVVRLRVEPVGTGKRRAARNDPEQHVKVEGRHPALVEPSVFEECQGRLREQRRNTTPVRGCPLTLRGLLWCDHCGRRMVGRHSRGVPGYLCGGYLAHGKRVCHYNRVPEAPLVQAVLRKIKERFTEDVIAQCREAVRLEAGRGRPGAGDLDRRRARLASLEAQLATATRRYSTEEDEALVGALREDARRLVAERDRAASDLAAALRRAEDEAAPEADVEAAVEVIRQFDRLAEHATPAELRAVLLDHVERLDMRFSHRPKGAGQVACEFAEGVITLREGSPLCACLSTSHRSR